MDTQMTKGTDMTIQDLKDAYELLGLAIDQCIAEDDWKPVGVLIGARVHVHDMIRCL